MGLKCDNLGTDFIGDLQRMKDGILVKEQKTASDIDRKPGITAIFVIRHEYANFYHTTMSLYDVFLILVVFELNPSDVDVRWMNSHPETRLDNVWEILFRAPIRIGSIRKTVMYPIMLWDGFGPHSRINQHKLESLPYVEEFRHFVLSRFDVTEDHVRRCNRLKITIIWRRDYVVHPRNPNGFTSRKFENEEEVWTAIKTEAPSAEVNDAQIDKLDIQEQLDFIARTDILIGMHGAGLSHILYLPRPSGVIELYPSYTSPGNAHFRSMARWRRLPYVAWLNQNKVLEGQGHKTKVPQVVLQDMVRTMIDAICVETD